MLRWNYLFLELSYFKASHEITLGFYVAQDPCRISYFVVCHFLMCEWYMQSYYKQIVIFWVNLEKAVVK